MPATCQCCGPKIYARYGSGGTRDRCGDTILPAQVEYEMASDDGRAYRLHLGSAGLWEAELRRCGVGQ
jgi:hypothetical protein